MLDGDAAETLTDNGFSLYAYQAVDTNIAGWPTVWYATALLTPSMTLSWTAPGYAYTALATDIAPPGVVVPGATYPLGPGQTLQVDTANGTGSIINAGPPDCLTIANQTTTQFSCGPAWSAAGMQPAPACALELFGGNDVLIRPRNTVLLAFESGTRVVGQAVETLSAPALLVSLAKATSRSVSYSLNTNWAANTADWASQYPAGTELPDVLISTVLTPLLQTHSS